MLNIVPRKLDMLEESKLITLYSVCPCAGEMAQWLDYLFLMPVILKAPRRLSTVQRSECRPTAETFCSAALEEGV